MENALSYRFGVGSLDCTALLDGYEEISPAQVLFENATADELSIALAKYGTPPTGSLQAMCICLLIRMEQHTLLVDTGLGRLEPTGGHLVAALREAGTEPQDIDLVILSHGHPDHIAGITSSDGPLVFPNAQWVIDREEWRCWIETPLPPSVPTLFGEIARRELQPIADRVALVDKPRRSYPACLPCPCTDIPRAT